MSKDNGSGESEEIAVGGHDRWLSPEKFAPLISTTPRVVISLVKDGVIEARKRCYRGEGTRGRYFIRASEANRYMESLPLASVKTERVSRPPRKYRGRLSGVTEFVQ